MLEKIGLPPKPSLRGNTWVVDASHCQGCSSQFTFINRKHHCRRCGGIFCNRCTQQRMLLRGQGDSPVRICEPCKKLEEAARFEMRYGHKNRAAKGGSKNASTKEDEILSQILGNDDRAFSSQNSSASSSNIAEVATQIVGGDTVRNRSLDQPADMATELESATPEDLRQLALAEKQKYKTLKAEGKSEEALKAFKRGKELERQAAALEISLRKNRKKALSLSSSNNINGTEQFKDDFNDNKNKLLTQKSKRTDDLSAELKELGWSDLDLRDAEKGPKTLTLEGELSSLLREVSQKPNKEKQSVNVSSDRSQVIVHKKRALELKRAGNLIEAKEELKKAKILERKIEEEELLGNSDDESDDELSSLIRGMDDGDENDLLARHKPDLDFDFNHFSGIAEDLAVDGNFEITDEDMDDPEIASALKSLGWTEDSANSENLDSQMASSDRETVMSEIQTLKREALNQKRAGNNAEALALLKKAKLLEKELENSDTQVNTASQSAEEQLVSTKARTNDAGPKSAPKSKLTIQRELLALKKKALTLRREGKLDESEEELKKAKALEDMNKDPPKTQPSTGNKPVYNMHATVDNGDEEEVTDQDLHDPSYLSLLKNLGWEDEDNNSEVQGTTSKENNRSSKHTSVSSIPQSVTNVEAVASKKSKSEIQRELLMLKRKALTLRRQGEADEADEVLKMVRLLEAQLDEFEKPSLAQEDPPEHMEGNASSDVIQSTISSIQVDLHDKRFGDSERQVEDKVRIEEPEKVVHENEKQPYIQELQSSPATNISEPHSSSIEQEIRAHKRKAVAFKREGKLAEAKEELREAKLLETRLEEMMPQATTTTNSSESSMASNVSSKVASPSSVSKPLSSRDKFKLQQESLAHKRKALKLRREGKTAEADAEFELAKALESQLQEMDDSAGASKSGEPVGDVSVEDFLDPQLLSALNSIGLGDGETRSQGLEKQEPIKFGEDGDDAEEREQLVARIKAEKVKAVNLKRSGKQAEALDALRRAKLYEKKLQTLTSK